MDLVKAIKNEIRIYDYCLRMGYRMERSGHEYRLLDEPPITIGTIKIDPDKNSYYRHSTGEGGYSIIDFVMLVENRTQQQAIKYLRGFLYDIATYRATLISAQPSVHPEPERRELESPQQKETKYNRLFAYLIQNRCIAPEVVTALVKKKLIYEDRRGNICFAGYDYDRELRYVGLRTTSDSGFRGDARGSDKAVGFTIGLVEAETPPTKLFVTESAIDCMSLLTIAKLREKPLLDSGFLSLGGTFTKTLQYHLEHNPQLDTVYLCQDSDEAGRRSRNRCTEVLRQAGFAGKIVERFPETKDFNQDLQALTQTIQKERGIQHEFSLEQHA